MAFNKDLVMWIIESFITHKKSEITVSSDMKKKFSDVAKYARENKIGKSMAGKTVQIPIMDMCSLMNTISADAVILIIFLP